MLESNSTDIKKIGWNRSSRTDKGVHSVSSVFSMKLELDPLIHLHPDDPLGNLTQYAVDIFLQD